MLPVRKLFLAAVFVARASVDAHAILTSPVPRAGTNTGTGIKLQPFADARTIANSGCGGISNKDPGTTVPTTTYQSGATIEVEWKLTIPHPADNLLNGVRVALHVSATDSFDQNILAGGAEGDPPYTKVPAGDDGDASNAVKTVTVTLPAGKTCDLCTLQWMWSAQSETPRLESTRRPLPRAPCSSSASTHTRACSPPLLSPHSRVLLLLLQTTAAPTSAALTSRSRQTASRRLPRPFPCKARCSPACPGRSSWPPPHRPPMAFLRRGPTLLRRLSGPSARSSTAPRRAAASAE